MEGGEGYDRDGEGEGGRRKGIVKEGVGGRGRRGRMWERRRVREGWERRGKRDEGGSRGGSSRW
jgi:hypothetical protein